jgi:hypothetical protein
MAEAQSNRRIPLLGPTSRGETAEQGRLDACTAGTEPWQDWVTYLSERLFGQRRRLELLPVHPRPVPRLPLE